ncbi:uromodulin-like [Ranitomeya imitator]|uniref:uromodulin-like n=1 Tax=Ranitomeya imitator TaxID=111125 RepID=UPI0037E84E44
MKYHIVGLLLMLCTCASGWTAWPLTTVNEENTTSPPYTRTTSSYYYYYTVISSSTSNISCDNGETVFPSFTVVMDTTGSMSSYLYQFQDIARFLSTRLAASSANVTRQYTLMEFNDPSVGPLHVTCSSTEFFNALYYLYAHEGGDCPEFAMLGLLTALQASPFGSFVVLVTDASAKDSGDLYVVNKIFSLLDSLRVKVFLFASSCGDTSLYEFQVYKEIASRSYGHVFQVYYPTTNIADLLNFFLKIPVNSTSRLFSVENSGYYRYSFSVPSELTSLIISASGSNYSVNLYNPSGSLANLTTYFSESWGSVFYLESPVPGLWIFEGSAESSSIRIEGYKANSSLGNKFNESSFCSRCDSNAICQKDLLDYTCICKEGFGGDGFSCYDTDECDYYRWPNPCSLGACINTYGSYYCSCPSGYTWEHKTCADVDECSARELNNCHPHATCNNTYGSYSCYCAAGYYGDGYKCELDECSRDVCGFGRECVNSGGSHNCSDPCFSYTTLNEPSRSTSYYDYYYYYYYYYYYGRSDYYLNGWYRFMGSGGIRMAEFCPSYGSCYTRYPMWLNGIHPEPADGIVNRTVCTSDSGICCQWSSNVMVKACPGGFHVYKFSWPPMYYSGYCTDPTTVPESCSCADDEECKAVGGRYSCYCKNDVLVSAIDKIRPVLTCGNQEIKASFQKCHLKKFKLDTNNIHLKDSSCRGFNDFNLTNIITVVSILKKDVCGNELLKNSTYVTYKNTIFLSMETNSSLGGEDVLEISYSCVYPLDMRLSLETALNPFASSVIVEMVGTGKLEVTMALYRDSTYTTPYEGSEVLLTSKTNLFIGIMMKIGDISQYAVQITNCYAAASANATSKYDIIKESCPSKQDSTINVIKNGESVNAQFSVQLFGYLKDSNVVYLYCDIHICDKTCAPVCAGAKAVSTSESVTSDARLVVGPIIRQDVTTPNSGAGAYPMVASLATVLLFLSGTLLFTF